MLGKGARPSSLRPALLPEGRGIYEHSPSPPPTPAPPPPPKAVFWLPGSLTLHVCGDTGQSGSPREDIALSEGVRWTLSPWSVDGRVLWVSCLFLGVTRALSSLRGVRKGRDGSVPAQLRLGSWGGPLWPDSQASPPLPTGCPAPGKDLSRETRHLGRGKRLRWLHSGQEVGWGWPAANCRGHHNTVASF